MDIKIIKKDGYNLHLIKNKNFKTILAKVVFWEPIKEEEITIRNMLVSNLLFSSLSYPTQKELTTKKQDLYGVGIGGGTYRNGNYIFSELILSMVDEKYTKKGLTKESLEFFFDMIHNPNVYNDEFNKEGFSYNYEVIQNQINSEKENPNYYSLMKYKSLLGNNKPFSLSLEGKIEDLKAVSERDLYQYYKSFISNNNIDLFVIGNINLEEIENIIDDNFKLKGKNEKITDLYVSYQKPFTEEVIKSDFSQSRLIMGGQTLKLTDHEKKYEAMIYNIIFGNSPNSKLFKNVREKHSYAYSISSSFVRLDEMFYITAGISKENYEDTKSQIFVELEEMKRGNFTQKDLTDAKEVILSILREIDDYQGSILEHYFNNLYLESDDIEEMTRQIEKITKEDIINLSKKINIDTILLVEEKENGKN